MSNLRDDQAFLKMSIPEQMRNDIKTLAFLDGVTLKAKVVTLIDGELAVRRDELREMNERRQRQTGWLLEGAVVTPRVKGCDYWFWDVKQKIKGENKC